MAEFTGNALDLIANTMIQMQLESINTQETVGTTNELITNANEQLVNLWTTSPETSIYNKLKNMSLTQLTSWIQTNLEKTDHLTYSQEFIKEVEGLYLSACNSKKKNPEKKKPDSATLGLLNSISNLISSSAQADEQPGNTLISTLNTLSQRFESDQGPLTSSSSSIIDAANNYSTAEQSITA